MSKSLSQSIHFKWKRMLSMLLAVLTVLGMFSSTALASDQAPAYAATGDYVDSYKLVVNGDWILFLVAPNAAEGETAFNNYLK